MEVGDTCCLYTYVEYIVNETLLCGVGIMLCNVGRIK